MHTETEANQVKERRAVADWTQCSWLLAILHFDTPYARTHSASRSRRRRASRASYGRRPCDVQTFIPTLLEILLEILREDGSRY